MSRKPLLCIAGGGTGGHVMPALALADAARDRWPELQVSFIGAERGLEARLLPERGEQVLLLAMHGVKGAGLLQKLRVLLWELPKSVVSIRKAWKQQRPDLLVGVGGYASISGVAAALISRIPVVLYEQNAMPGLVNRTLSRFCKRIMLGFAEATAHLSGGTRMSATGNIVRQVIADVQWQAHAMPRLLVLGGSQGAQVLNQTVPLSCEMLVNEGREFEITHVAGNEAAAKLAREIYQRAGLKAEVLPFCNDMPAFYASGSLMVARSGAMTVSEAAVCGMPTLFVPLPHAADDHQRFNAESLACVGGAVVLSQQELSAESLAATIDEHLFDEKKLAVMSRSAQAWAPFDASDKQLNVLAEFLPVLADADREVAA
ncbi:UDP-N-acetylglucosamine--N-acetylmuramyl-(pentapeptide) pyrophosphoryl-undecaprenol N-acetylglucosamine transferase [Mariprofundus micogutta]|uniref:UDP-N-acetylglucosamine--N-acetylmuramyl-(pentapeptide) pyrophosphoryl-undecaprenol N-acetylglucosamine transferase n=1 Tax=Mariprofundus micogutta TaxID=1921010 RepID=A0A1L8CKV6_9PROT|nr:undecaprenyldiphospho-muramoylpentapeptide beta-N-acetylglucosaminyltransferase [Mariprofundus micogutta]GAV19532.1 UDP-N-acetylglucosamine--N-acetylmuramyl-(pentapeptide) pyrophosphoryl-undecaprenol N-acetylglucosamine transferase [Mariprofundus micogutta]